MSDGLLRLRRLASRDLRTDEIAATRALMLAAFGTDEEERFTDHDWAHALGGTHLLLDRDGILLSHASVVEREIHIGGRPLRAGYVEAVATDPAHQGAGFGTVVIEAIDAIIRGAFEVGVLGTGAHRFYQRLGWETWTGPLFVRTADGPVRTPEEEGYVLVLRTPTSPPFELDEPMSCDWRPGDVW